MSLAAPKEKGTKLFSRAVLQGRHRAAGMLCSLEDCGGLLNGGLAPIRREFLDRVRSMGARQSGGRSAGRLRGLMAEQQLWGHALARTPISRCAIDVLGGHTVAVLSTWFRQLCIRAHVILNWFR